MAEKYTFSNTDFSNDIADLNRLTLEIENSNITTPLDYIESHATLEQVDIYFNTTLSGTEPTTLSGIVAAHTGEPYIITFPNVFSGHNGDTTQSFTSDTTINFSEIRKDILFTTEEVGGGTEITINRDGWCKVNFAVSIDSVSGSSRSSSKTWLEKNGTLVPGTNAFGYHRNANNGEDTASCIIDLQVNKGDVLRLRSTRLAGNATLTTIGHGCRLRIEILN
jgi:hypothetical protein